MEELMDFKNVCGGDDGSHSRARSRHLECSHIVAGFVIFIVASLAWLADGWRESKASLVIQNVILLLINALGSGAGFRRPRRRLSRKRATSVAKPAAPQEGPIDSDRRFGTFGDGNRYQ
jgi:hypothetical protein